MRCLPSHKVLETMYNTKLHAKINNVKAIYKHNNHNGGRKG